ncbi:PIR Superfamily Protein [Plasmodium ovale wallikeri]|uniref:PIR Superfamily Protein n=1 Tax=Plasmodium ovale wallikeri TaxID=864142 RepID=A0A1A9AH02_PLAOA|nr:PIR Superfamily Protein [Plasmodium ovale wallikeri]
MNSHHERGESYLEIIENMYLNRTRIGIATSAADTFKTNCDEIFRDNSSLNSKFNKTCCILLGYLKLSSTTGISSGTNNYCEYANYWLNEQVRNEKDEYHNYISTFFNTLSNSQNTIINNSTCKNEIYDLSDEVFNKIQILYTFYEEYNDFKLIKMTNPNSSCNHAEKCARTYMSKIGNCSTQEDKFCTILRKFKNNLMNELITSAMCAEQQNLLYTVDTSIAEYSLYSQGGPRRVLTYSVSTIGPMAGAFLLLLLLYKATPFGSWLSPRMKNIKKNLNIVDNAGIESLFNYSGTPESNFTKENYNVSYNLVGSE